jgi:2,3-dihydroxy-2,3-dihydro-p-cumate dehydrogenase
VNDGRHRGRIAFVTGVSETAGGVGLGIARRLAAGGAALAIADLDRAVVPLGARLADELGVPVAAFAGDLSDEPGVARIVAAIEERFGAIDILVNNAGGGIIRPFLEHTPDTLRTTVDRNLWTAIWCTYHVLPGMVRRNFGRVVNIGADSVRNGLMLHAGYNAAKGGVHAMTTGLAREFAEKDIAINTVAPCWVATRRYHEAVAADTPMAREFLSAIPKGRAVEIEEIAGYVDYLAGAEAGFVTGQVVSINGGSAML